MPGDGALCNQPSISSLLSTSLHMKPQLTNSHVQNAGCNLVDGVSWLPSILRFVCYFLRVRRSYSGTRVVPTYLSRAISRYRVVLKNSSTITNCWCSCNEGSFYNHTI